MNDFDVTSYLREITESLRKSDAYYFTVSFDSSYENDSSTAIYTHQFDKQITLEVDKYELGLLGLDTYYSIPNITSSRNGNFRYSVDNGTTWKLVVVPTGSYELKTLGEKITELVTPDTNGIVIVPDIALLKTRIKLISRIVIDFTYPNSINYILGFNSRLVQGTGNHYSDNIVNIQPINSLNVHVDCIDNSYSNGKSSSAIFGFFPDVSPGEKIIIDRSTPIYLPFNKTNLNSITVWITDQTNNLVNFRGENINIRFHLRRK